ncbi:MAG: phenylacetic acid degradation protein PaaD [Xanthomonadales bacterium]|nr:phenylacetic acid degradation protein PaaD [Xanthomonadales bacterium]
MLSQDSASTRFGMELLSMAPGRAEVSMRIRSDMLNGLGSCHGGIIFSLADTAFAFACNSRNEVTVAAGASIEFLRPGISEQLLIATAEEAERFGRHGIYDVVVRNNQGEIVAVFRGKSTQRRGQVLPASA